MAPTATDTDEILDLTRPAEYGNGEVDEPEPELLASGPGRRAACLLLEPAHAQVATDTA